MAIDEIERTEMVQKLIGTLDERPAGAQRGCADTSSFSTAIETALARQRRVLAFTLAGFTLVTWVLMAISALT